MSLFSRRMRPMEFSPILVEIAKLELGPSDILLVKLPKMPRERWQDVAWRFKNQLDRLGVPRFLIRSDDVGLEVVTHEALTWPVTGEVRASIQPNVTEALERRDRQANPLRGLETFDSVVLEAPKKSTLCTYCEKVDSDKCLGGHEICEYAKHG